MTVINLDKLILYNDVWYKLLRYLPEHNVTDKGGTVRMDVLQAWRDYVGTDRDWETHHCIELICLNLLVS